MRPAQQCWPHWSTPGRRSPPVTPNCPPSGELLDPVLQTRGPLELDSATTSDPYQIEQAFRSLRRKGTVMNGHWPVPAGLRKPAVALPVEGVLPSFDGATGWLNSHPLTCGRPAREGRPGQLLDLHLHQLATPAPLRPRVGREVPGPGAGRDRGAHARVPVRTGRRQRPSCREGHADRLPGRDRQRLRDMARVRQPLLAGALLRRRARPSPASPLRRRRVRQSEMVIQQLLVEAGLGDVGQDLVSVDATGIEAAADWATPEITGELHRVRAHRELRIARRRPADKAGRLHRSRRN